MDFIYWEIFAGVMDKRIPALAPYIQTFINHVYEGDAMAGHDTVNPKYFTPSFIKGPELPEFAKGKGPSSNAPSTSRGPAQKSGISSFF